MKQIGAFSEDMAMSVVLDLVKNNIEDFANDEERETILARLGKVAILAGETEKEKRDKCCYEYPITVEHITVDLDRVQNNAIQKLYPF
jgi:hypothetical protein